MAILKVAQIGHPVLRQVAKPVSLKEIKTEDFQRLIDDMIDTMRDQEGAGLAAPQVHVSKRVVVIEVEENPRYPHQEHIELLVLINPKIKVVSERTEEDWEGCLSVDGFRGRVPRAYAVEVEAYNREAMRLRFRAEGFFARAVQHECDHLDGILYVDRMRDMKTLTNTEDFMRYWVADDSE